MKYFSSISIPIKFRMQLRALYTKGSQPISLLRIENLILEELAGFSSENRTSKVFQQKLILDLNKTLTQQSSYDKLKLLIRILRTRGQLRWMCFNFFSPVLNDAFEISRGKLLRRIILEWKKFSSEVLSQLYLTEGDTEQFGRISLDTFSNPNLRVELNRTVPYLLEGEYLATFTSSKYRTFLRKYLLGRIILWNPSFAITFIENSVRLLKSDDFNNFIQAVPHFKTQIESRTKIKFKLHPKSTYTLDQRADTPNSNWPDTVKNVEIWHQRFIIKDDEWLIIDSTTSPYINFVAGHWQFLNQIESWQDHIRLKKPRDSKSIHIEEAIYLVGRADENWYHLLLDTLPRYLNFESISHSVPVLIRSDLPTTSIEFLQRLIPRTFIFIEPSDRVFVESLHFFAGRSTTFDSEPATEEERVKFSPKVFAQTRNWILETLEESVELSFPLDFYINRDSKYRNVINAQSVVKEFRKHNYAILHPTKEFFSNQSQYFAHASHIVSPGGAALANMLFMKKGSQVTVIQSSRGSNLDLWKKFAESCGIDYSEVTGYPTYYGRKALAREHSDFYIPIWKVRKLLKSKISLSKQSIQNFLFQNGTS
jgi:hypothetical protein